MSLFGNSPYLLRGDCNWKNETSNTFGDRLPLEMHRKVNAPKATQRDMPIALSELRDSAGTGMAATRSHEDWVAAVRANSCAESEALAKEQVLPECWQDKVSRLEQTISHIGNEVRKTARSVQKSRGRPVSACSHNSVHAGGRSSIHMHDNSTSLLGMSNNRPESVTPVRSKPGVLQVTYNYANPRPVSAALQRSLMGPARHPKPVAEWKPNGWVHQTTRRLDPTPEGFPVTAARVCAPFQDTTDTGDIPGHARGRPTAHIITSTISRNARSDTAPPPQSVSTVRKLMGSPEISVATRIRMEYPPADFDPRPKVKKPVLKPQSFNSTGFNDGIKDSFYVSEIKNPKITVGFGQAKPQKDPYLAAYLHGRTRFDLYPPHGYVWSGVHSGRYQTEPKDGTFDGSRKLQKRHMPRAKRSGIASLVGMPGTTEVTQMF